MSKHCIFYFSNNDWIVQNFIWSHRFLLFFFLTEKRFPLWGTAQNVHRMWDYSSLKRMGPPRKGVSGTQRRELQMGADAGRCSLVLTPEHPEPGQWWQLHMPAIWVPLQATTLLAWQHHPAWRQAWTFPFIFLILRLDYCNGFQLIRWIKNLLFKGSKKDLGSKNPNSGKDRCKICNRPFWDFKTCLAPDPSVGHLSSLSPKIRNDTRGEPGS